MSELLNSLEEYNRIETTLIKTERDCKTFFINNSLQIFTLFHMNIRSLEKHFDELKILLSEINVDFDIIVLTETWQTDNDCFNIDGYTQFKQPNKFNKCDGIVVYIKSEYNAVSLNSNISDANILDLQIYINRSEVLNITSIYRSPSFNMNDFIVSLDNLLQSKRNIGNHIIVGDININIYNCRTSSQIYEYLEH